MDIFEFEQKLIENGTIKYITSQEELDLLSGKNNPNDEKDED